MHHFRFPHRTMAAVLGVLAVAYTVQAYRIPEFAGVDVPVQPGTLPRGLGLVLIVLSVALFFQRQPAEQPALAQRDKARQDTPGQAIPGPDTSPRDAPEPAGQENPDKGTGDGRSLGRFSDARLELAALLMAIGLYVALFVPLGFVLSTALFVTGTAWYLGYRRHWANALVGIGVALALYLGMSEGLAVALPTGPLPF